MPLQAPTLEVHLLDLSPRLVARLRASRCSLPSKRIQPVNRVLTRPRTSILRAAKCINTCGQQKDHRLPGWLPLGRPRKNIRLNNGLKTAMMRINDTDIELMNTVVVAQDSRGSAIAQPSINT